MMSNILWCLAQIREIMEPIPGKLMQDELVEAIRELKKDLVLNAGLLASQCDMARQAEIDLGRVKSLARELARALDEMIAHYEDFDSRLNSKSEMIIKKARKEGVIG